MHADKVEVSWDAGKHKWLVRIEAGSEVIRRYCNHSKDAGADELRAAAAQTAMDDGYQVEPAAIAISR